MSRRTFVGIGAVMCSAMIASCSGNPNSNTTVDQPAEEPEAPAEDTAQTEAPADGDAAASAKVLVAYYSRADENYGDGGTEWLEVGHTKVMAGYIAETLGADTYEIVPEVAYPEGYDDCCDLAKEEQRDDARPAIAGELPDVSGYEVVFLGCPIWWGEEPMIVRTFLEGVDLSGKTVVPFTTHGGSGLGSVPGNLQSLVPGATHLEGLAVAGTAVDGAHDEVASWAKGLSLA